jgi:hypothetical protein
MQPGGQPRADQVQFGFLCNEAAGGASLAVMSRGSLGVLFDDE